MVHHPLLLEEPPLRELETPGPVRLRLEPAAALSRYAAAIADLSRRCRPPRHASPCRC